MSENVNMKNRQNKYEKIFENLKNDYIRLEE